MVLTVSPVIRAMVDESFPGKFEKGELGMKRKRFTEELIIDVLREHEAVGPEGSFAPAWFRPTFTVD
ncbi:MAG: hypothetical protein ACE5H8_13540 [Alphaproteobacteria bacterium]